MVDERHVVDYVEFLTDNKFDKKFASIVECSSNNCKVCLTILLKSGH